MRAWITPAASGAGVETLNGVTRRFRPFWASAPAFYESLPKEGQADLERAAIWAKRKDAGPANC